MEVAASIVSGLAGLAAVVFACQSAMDDTSMARIEGDRRADEVVDRDRAEQASMRADLRIDATLPEQNSNPSLVVTNHGGGVASDVFVRVDGPGIPPGGEVRTRGLLEPGGRWHLDSVGNANLKGRRAEVELRGWTAVAATA